MKVKKVVKKYVLNKQHKFKKGEEVEVILSNYGKVKAIYEEFLGLNNLKHIVSYNGQRYGVLIENIQCSSRTNNLKAKIQNKIKLFNKDKKILESEFKNFLENSSNKDSFKEEYKKYTKKISKIYKNIIIEKNKLQKIK